MGCSVVPITSCVPPQIIDTVPMDETTEEMFGYFEPLYEVIRDMPRPPEAFFKRKGGEWEPLHSACAQRISHLHATLFSPGMLLLLAAAPVQPLPPDSALPEGTAFRCCQSGGQDGHNHVPSDSPSMTQLLLRCLFGHCRTSVSSSDASVFSVWALSLQNFEEETWDLASNCPLAQIAVRGRAGG